MFKQILIPVDLTDEEQIPELFRTVQRLVGSDKATIHLLYVDQSLIHQSSYPFLDDDTFTEHRKEAERKMVTLLEDMPDNLQAVSHSKQGIAHDQILETADELDIDAIIMAARSPGLKNYFIGSNAERVVRHAKCSVLIIRSRDDS
jgi:nucleotide-binding universal stress UspA family protein